MSSTPPDDPNPYGNDPHGRPIDPHAQNPYAQNPYGQNPPGQNPPGQDPYRKDPYGQQPGQMPPPQDPYGQQNPYGQNPYGQPHPGHDPYGQPQFAQAPQWTATDSIAWGWRAFKGNWGVLVLMSLALFVVTGVITTLGTFADGGFDALFSTDPDVGTTTTGPAGTLASILTMVISLVFTAAFAKGAILATRGHRLKFGDLVSDINWVQVVLSSLLVSVITFVGLVLCILPGIVAGFFLCFTTLAVVGKGDNAVEAVKTSFQLVKSSPLQVFVLLLLSTLIFIAGTCACGIGLLVACPVVVLALGHAFQALRGEPIVG